MEDFGVGEEIRNNELFCCGWIVVWLFGRYLFGITLIQRVVTPDYLWFYQFVGFIQLHSIKNSKLVVII